MNSSNSKRNSWRIEKALWQRGATALAFGFLSLQAVAAPVNDNFANATTLAASWTVAHGHNTNATLQAGEPRHSSDPNIPNGGRSVWWKWTPNFSGQVKITTANSGSTDGGADPFVDTQLAVYRGSSVSALTPVIRNEDHLDFAHGWSRVDFAVTAGTTYHIAVDSYGGHMGRIQLNFALTGAAPKYALTVITSPSGAGSVTLDPPQPDGGYDAGTIVTLSASGDFSAWGGAASGSSSSVSVTMNSPKSVTAIFGSNHKIVFQNPNNGQLSAWFLNGTSFLGGSLIRNGTPAGSGWKLVGVADFNGDESSDLLFNHNDGRLAVWFLDRASYQSASIVDNGRKALGWRVVGAGDFDTNGTPDIVFQNSNGVLALWRMNGINVISPSLIRGGTSAGAWLAVGVADINGNATSDIVFQHPDGRTSVWYMNGTTFAGGNSFRGGAKAAAGWKIVGLANLNGAGTADFLWQSTGGQLAVWFLNNTTQTGSATIRNGVSAGAWQARGVD